MSIQVLYKKKDEICSKGENVYQKIKDVLDPTYRGKIVAIEPESGDYFLGEDVVESTQLAKKKHPGKLFYYVKVGFPVVHIRR